MKVRSSHGDAIDMDVEDCDSCGGIHYDVSFSLVVGALYRAFLSCGLEVYVSTQRVG